MAVFLNQFNKDMPVTKIYEHVGFSAGAGSNILKQCVKRRFVKTIEVSIGKGRPKKFPILLPEAYTIIRVNQKKFYAKGAGHEHKLWQYFLKDHFSIFKPEVECNRNGKFVDIGFDVKERFICIEVAITSFNEKKNIEDDFLKAGGDYVIVGCINHAVLKAVGDIVKEMPEEFKSRVKGFLLSELLKRNPDELIEKIIGER